MRSSRFSRMSLRRQLILLFCLVILIPLLLLLGILYANAQRTVENDLTYAILQTLDQLAINIQYRMSAIMFSSSYLARNTDLYSLLLSSSTSLGDQITETYKLRNMLESVSTNLDVYRLRLFVDTDHLFTRDGLNIFPLSAAQDEPWYSVMISNMDTAIWQSTYWMHYPLSESIPVISHIRILRVPGQYSRILGFVVQDVQQNTFQQILAAANLQDQISIGIVDASGYFLSSANSQLLNTLSPHAQALTSIPTGSVSGRLKSNGTTVLYSRLAHTDWFILADISSLDAMNTIFRTSTGSMLVIVCIVLLVFSLCVFVLMQLFAGHVYRKTNAIIASVRLLGLEGLRDEELPSNHLNVLEKSINTLISSIRGMMDSIYQEKLYAKDMELKLMQAQINPHFLYNAIDQIYWKAIQHNAPAIAQMLGALARYFRLSLHKGQDIVTLADEIALIQSYLTLQKSRFGYRFTADIHVDAALSDCCLPKMTLQPLVENALLHGILRKNEPGRLSIDARLDEGFVLCAVLDDGLGMTKAACLQLLSSEESTRGSSSYGLYSVNKRLGLFFGASCALQISSKEGEGTTVSFRMPMRTLEDSSQTASTSPRP